MLSFLPRRAFLWFTAMMFSSAALTICRNCEVILRFSRDKNSPLNREIKVLCRQGFHKRQRPFGCSHSGAAQIFPTKKLTTLRFHSRLRCVWFDRNGFIFYYTVLICIAFSGFRLQIGFPMQTIRIPHRLLPLRSRQMFCLF